MKKKLLLHMSVLAAVLSISSISVFGQEQTAASQVIAAKETVQWDGLDKSEVLSLFKEVLDEEVAAGTITQAEADQKYASMQDYEHPPQMQGVDGQMNMTKEERLAKLKEMLDQEVAAGKITQTEADEKYTAIQNGQHPEMGEGDGKKEGLPEGRPEIGKGGDKKEGLTEGQAEMAEEERLAKWKEMLDQEVAAGKITQVEADEKYTAMENGQRPERDPKQSFMTDAEREALQQKILLKQS